MEDLTCKHCSNTVDGKFCSNCGQRYIETPYSKDVIPFLISQTIDFGANYFRTLGALFVKPNNVISTFLSGNVKTYVNPLKYAVLSVALLIVWDWSEAYITQDPDGASEGMEVQIYGIISGFCLYLVLINKLFWRDLNWVEHFIIGLYLSVQLLLVAILSFILFELPNDFGILEIEVDFTYVFFMMLGYYLFYYLSVFNKGKFATLIKSILFLLFAFVLLTIGFLVYEKLGGEIPYE